MMEKLKQILARYEEIEELLWDESVVNDPQKTADLLSEQGKLKKYVSLYQELKKIQDQKKQLGDFIASNKKEHEIVKLAEEELAGLEQQEEEIFMQIEERFEEDEAKISSNEVVMEIRPAAGGEEAALFAYDLLRMYTKLAEKKKWKIEPLDIQKSNLGGIKFASLYVEGKGVFTYLKYEAGCHRVQRVPLTEASGRIHTSTATVAILPQIEDINLEIKKEDLEIDTFRAGGPGGQYVNRTCSAVRIKHIPTKITVVCQVERSQHRNRELALKWLKAKLYEYYSQQQHQKISALRKLQIGTGERNEKIRTYNFMQNRVTDHRINYSIFDLQGFLDGNIEPMIERLRKHEWKKKFAIADDQ